MNRIEYIEIEGKRYPLCCSLGAMEELADAYGGADAFAKKMSSLKEFGAYIKTLAVFMKYGVARLRRTEENVPDALSVDELRLVLDPADFPDVTLAVNKAFMLAQPNEVKGKAKGKKKETE